MPLESELVQYDLHCHTTCSDGSLTPAELIQRAATRGVTHLAITDHDTISGLGIARAANEQLEQPMQLLNGVEISCQWEGFEIHLVGLNFDVDSPELTALLASQQDKRRQRFQAMYEKLQQIGFDIDLSGLDSATMPTRKHLASALVEQGKVSSFDGVFRRYLGKGQQAYVTPQWCDLATAIKALHAAGGVAVIAHPHAYQLSNKWLRRLLTEAKEVGLDGVEVAIGQQSPGQREALATFARELSLAASVGSDFHSPQPWRDLGKNLCLPDGCVPIWELM